MQPSEEICILKNGLLMIYRSFTLPEADKFKIQTKVSGL